MLILPNAVAAFLLPKWKRFWWVEGFNICIDIGASNDIALAHYYKKSNLSYILNLVYFN